MHKYNMKEKQENLKREVGLWGLSANIINIVIGAGIFVLPAIIAAGLGSASIVAYLFCGFLITLVMLCFAEVGSKITDTGGAYAYIEKTFGKYLGFVTAVFFLLASVSADAAISNALADIIASIFPLFQDKLIRILFFIILFCGLGYINIIGLKKGVGFVKIITILKITPLLILILIGFKEVTIANLYWESIPTIKNVGEMSLILFFAFQGAEVGLSISGEVKNPKKTIPNAIRLSVVGILIVYILIQTISQGVLGASLASFQENPLAEVANHLIGPIGFTLITIGAAVSMFGGLSSDILCVPRVLFAASKDDVIPFKKLSMVHKKYATPHISIIAYASLGLLFASIGGFKQLAIISSASSLLIYLGVSLATIKLRRQKNSGSSTELFRIPGGYTVPILSSIVIIWLISNLSKNEFTGVGLFILALTIVYFLINPKIRKRLTKNIMKSAVNTKNEDDSNKSSKM